MCPPRILTPILWRQAGKGVSFDSTGSTNVLQSCSPSTFHPKKDLKNGRTVAHIWDCGLSSPWTRYCNRLIIIWRYTVHRLLTWDSRPCSSYIAAPRTGSRHVLGGGREDLAALGRAEGRGRWRPQSAGQLAWGWRSTTAEINLEQRQQKQKQNKKGVNPFEVCQHKDVMVPCVHGLGDALMHACKQWPHSLHWTHKC